MTNIRIIILEDELSLAYTLSAALEKNLGADSFVKICSTAEVALQMMQIHKFDLIISDWQLPGISGLEFITQVRQSLPDVPIIFMTAFGTDQLEEQVQTISDYYIKKPFEIPQLTNVIDKLLHLEQEPPSMPQQNNTKNVSISSRRILVLEDDESLLNLYRKVFQKSGYIVHTAKTLPEANSLLGGNIFDMFICDVRIDKSFGVDLLLIWRDKLVKNKTRVVVISGDPWYRQMSEKVGADFFFRKPVEMATLINLANSNNTNPQLTLKENSYE